MGAHRRRRDRLIRGLGWASLVLGTVQLASPSVVARTVGVGASERATRMIRLIGARELVQGAALLWGPSRATWGRVGGDFIDLAALTWAMRAGSHRASWFRPSASRSRRRIAATTAAVATMTAADLYATLRDGRGGQHGDGRPGPLRLRASVTVNKPPQEVYAFWRDFPHLPTFMRHVESVTELPDGLYRWKVTAPLGVTIEWDAELTGDEPGTRISWLSVPGSEVDNSGTVHFAPAPGGRGTEVHVVLHYDVPGGTIGALVAMLFGEEPHQQVRDDLLRFKQMLETGDVVRSDAFPDGPESGHSLVQRPAQPREASEGQAPPDELTRRASSDESAGHPPSDVPAGQAPSDDLVGQAPS